MPHMGWTLFSRVCLLQCNDLHTGFSCCYHRAEALTPNLSHLKIVSECEGVPYNRGVLLYCGRAAPPHCQYHWALYRTAGRLDFDPRTPIHSPPTPVVKTWSGLLARFSGFSSWSRPLVSIGLDVSPHNQMIKHIQLSYSGPYFVALILRNSNCLVEGTHFQPTLQARLSLFVIIVRTSQTPRSWALKFISTQNMTKNTFRLRFLNNGPEIWAV